MAIKWKWLHEMMDDFRAGVPGNRFITVYRHRRIHGREHPIRSIVYIGFGFLFLIVGTIIALPPGVPGFFLWIPGLLMIATRLRWAAALMDRLEVWTRRMIDLFRRKQD
jgi:hypothetical protein